MFINLEYEMKKNDVSKDQLKEAISVSIETLNNRLSGRKQFYRDEMFQIQKKFFPNCTLEYLFFRKDEDN